MNSVLLKVYLFPKRSSTKVLATISTFGSSTSEYFYNDVFLYRSILGTVNHVSIALRISKTISFLSRYPSFPVSKISQKISTFAYEISRFTIRAKQINAHPSQVSSPVLNPLKRSSYPIIQKVDLILLSPLAVMVLFLLNFLNTASINPGVLFRKGSMSSFVIVS